MSTSNDEPIDDDDVDADIRRVCSLLESIAENYPHDSPESLALQVAANAYILVRQKRSLTRAWQRLKSICNGEVSDEITSSLHRMGIDVDALEEDQEDA